jgi:hypothetical protein
MSEEPLLLLDPRSRVGVTSVPRGDKGRAKAGAGLRRRMAGKLGRCRSAERTPGRRGRPRREGLHRWDHHERPPRPSSLFALGVCRFSVEPAGEGAWRDDGDQLPDGRAHGLAILEQPLPLVGSDRDAMGEFVPSNAVLGLEVREVTCPFAVGGTGQQYEECLEQTLHGGRIRKPLPRGEETTFSHTVAGLGKAGGFLIGLRGRSASGTGPVGVSSPPGSRDELLPGAGDPDRHRF